ncbi:Leucine-rich repeat-containing protein [Pseudomonas savastanoi pv. phaseolicola]|nr:Leucine-rich repeat-containing protein [Pseudomonas savastanoi pv. phaseolicola]
MFEKLSERLHPKVKKGGFFERQWLEREADRNARLDLRETPLQGPLPEALYDRKRAALKDNALFHGVPTAAQDQKTVDERVQYFKDKAFDVLNIAAFVVPVLGEVMMAVTAIQLAHEVYEGIESWAKDEKQQALAYLFDVVENIALMSALGAAATGSAGIPAIQVPEFVNGLKPVELPSGMTRLWKPDLTPFSHDIVLPKGLLPNATGLYTWQGKQWLPLEGRTYSVIPAPTGDGYLMEHPSRPDSYQPALRHNGAGAWLHELDRLLEMEGLTLFRRLGYSSEAFPDSAARRIIKVSNTPESVMRQALAEQRRPPALLEDTARRFRLDQEIDRFIEQMEANDADAAAPLQLELLSQDSGWPNNRALVLVDAQGNTLQKFVAAQQSGAAAPLDIHIRADQPDALRQVLEKLNNIEIRTLLNEEFGAGQPGIAPRLSGLYLENISIEPRVRPGAELSTPVATDLPRQLTNSFELGHFLQRFPHTRSLILVGEPGTGADPQISAFLNLPQQVSSALPQLTELGLINQSIFLDQAQMDHLRDMPDLRSLNLSGNRLVSLLPMDLGWLHLDRLILERVGMHRWPSWLTDIIPNNIRELSVAHNNLTELPDWILDNPLNPEHQTLIDLRGNSLSRHTVMHARINEAVPDCSFRFLMDTPLAVQAAINMQLREGAELSAALDQWTHASNSLAITSERTLEARREIGRILTDHWRAFSLGQIHRPLRLENLSLADFPRQLPEFFYRQIRYLHLSRVTTTGSDLEKLLRRMTDLSSLVMNGHVAPLLQLPPALLELPSLRSLLLIDQGMVIEQKHIDFFSRIPTLARLELDGNRMGAISDLSALNNTALNWLSLNNVGLTEWPTWVDDMIPAHLGTLLLEGNLITDLPEHILANPGSESAHTEISLLNNPLSEDSMRRAHFSERYGRSFTFDMDLPPELAAMDWTEQHDSDSSISDYESEDSRESTPEPVTADPWLDDSSPLSATRRALWEQLEISDHNRRLLDLIGSLRHSADYRNTASRAALQERVWRVLGAVSQDPQLGTTLSAIAEELLRLFRDNNTCPDGILLEFNQMEVMVFIRQSLHDVVPEQRGALLYRLTTRLYRLSELDAAAREQTGGRDEAEVRLAYRIHWASALDLPVPPEGMLYQAHAAIRPGEFETALLRVQSGEQGEPFLRFAEQQDYWINYLRETHAGRFDELEHLYRTDLTRLTDEFEQRNISLDNPEYERRIREFEASFKAQQKVLIRELTNAEGLEHH